MVRKGYCYRVNPVGKAYRKSYPLREVKAKTIVKALEYAPVGSLDVIDVLLPNKKIKNVYSFQLSSKPIRCPRSLRKKI